MLRSGVVVAVAFFLAFSSAFLLSSASFAGVVVLRGSGATFPEPQIQVWISRYQSLNPGVRIEYVGKGSGGGQNDFKIGLVDFAGSDPPAKEGYWRELSERGQPLQFPIVVGAIVVVYNLPGVEDLNLTRKALAGIFLGKIRFWDDPLIVEANPSARLPHREIIVVHRSDSSGTTKIFTCFLSSASAEWAEEVGCGKVVAWPVDSMGRGLGGKGNPGVVAVLEQTPYTIAYTELSYAVKERLKIAAVENKAGEFVKPTLESVQAAVAQAAAHIPDPSEGYKENLSEILDPPGRGAYPIVAFSHVLIWKSYGDPEKAQAIKDFFTWVLTEGQEPGNLVPGYFGLPREVAEIGLRAVEMVS